MASIAELKVLAEQYGLEVPSKVKKADLVAQLNEHRERAGLELLSDDGDDPAAAAAAAADDFEVPDVRRGECVDVHVPGKPRPELGLVHSIDDDGLADLTCFTDGGHGGCYGRRNTPCIGGPGQVDAIAYWSPLE